MKTIEISEATFSALRERVQDFGETPDSVIQRLLAGGRSQSPSALEEPSVTGELRKLLDSTTFQHLNGLDRYFRILGFLHNEKREEFQKLVGLKFGKRVQIAADKETIEQSGKSTFPKLIPGTPYWAVTNLSNRSKRDVVFSAMRMLNYPEAEIRMVVRSIPDSSPGRSSAEILRNI